MLNVIKINLFKILIVISILIITLSIFYYYVIFLPKNQTLKLQQEQKIRLLDYKIKFQKECEENYNKLQKKYEDDLNLFSKELKGLDLESVTQGMKQYINLLEKGWANYCKEFNYKFDMDNYIFCKNNIYYKHTFESYVPACIQYKIKQLYPNIDINY
jgi:hypothetical protein